MRLEQLLGIGVEVYGFDTGTGLPKPVDYRDLPNLYAVGDFAMEVEKLRGRLTTARLVLGDIRETLPRHLASGPAPVAFVSVDVDLYSSTVDALKLFDAPEDLLLPRVHCYFDDILGYTFSEFTGERLAISEFNACHATRKIASIRGLRHFVESSFCDQPWVEMMYLAHMFEHRLYNCDDGLSRRRTLNLADA